MPETNEVPRQKRLKMTLEKDKGQTWTEEHRPDCR